MRYQQYILDLSTFILAFKLRLCLNHHDKYCACVILRNY